LFLVSLLVVIAFSAQFKYDLGAPSRALFNQFVNDYGISFKDGGQAEQRFGIFEANLNTIGQLNSQNPRATFGINKFALLSSEEFQQQYLTLRAARDPNAPVAETFSQKIVDDIPTSFDWRPKGAVTPVKDQGQCGSCWAFSATGNIEGQWFLAGHPLTSLSEQNLVDCDHECQDADDCDAGCNGGLQPNAYQYVIKNGGIDTEDSYPYEAEDRTCRFKPASVGSKISNWTFVSKDEGQMAAYLVQHGPLAVAVDAQIWQFYVGGVITMLCGTDLDHGVLIVGYDVETDVLGYKINYWIIKNSWGADWGNSGYVYIERGNGQCGVDLYVTSSIV